MDVNTLKEISDNLTLTHFVFLIILWTTIGGLYYFDRKKTKLVNRLVESYGLSFRKITKSLNIIRDNNSQYEVIITSLLDTIDKTNQIDKPYIVLLKRKSNAIEKINLKRKLTKYKRRNIAKR